MIKITKQRDMTHVRASTLLETDAFKAIYKTMFIIQMRIERYFIRHYEPNIISRDVRLYEKLDKILELFKKEKMGILLRIEKSIIAKQIFRGKVKAND